MGMPSGKLVVRVVDTVVFIISDIDQPVIPSPAIGIDDALRFHMTPDDRLKRGFLAVRHNLGIDLSISLEQAKGYLFSHRPHVPVRL